MNITKLFKKSTFFIDFYRAFKWRLQTSLNDKMSHYYKLNYKSYHALCKELNVFPYVGLDEMKIDFEDKKIQLLAMQYFESNKPEWVQHYEALCSITNQEEPK